jgi:hypothetical protein
VARTMWLSMRRVIIAVVGLAACLSLAGCSHSNKAAFAKPLPSSLPHPIKASWMKPPQQLVRKLPSKVSSLKAPPPPVTKVQAPVRKVQEPTKVSSLKPPPLPPRKPQSPMHPSPSASVPREADEGRREVEAKFEAAQAKAKLGGVHTLTQEDIKGLSLEQIKELRGY